MPIVSVTRIWPDEEQLHVSIEVADDHPEGLLAEASRVTVELYADALGVTLAAVEDDSEPDGL